MTALKKIPAEVYSRVVGYFRPVSQWNNGKQAEFGDRKHMPAAKIAERMVGDHE